MLFVCVLGHTYKRRSEGWSFSFLSDPTPIIVYPCQWLTPLVETWIMWLWLRMMPATRLPNKQNNTYQAKPCQVELWIDDWFETLTKAKELNSLAGVPLAMFILGEEEEREKLSFLWKFQPLRKQPASSAIDKKMIKVEVLDNISKMWSPLNLPARTWSKKNLISKSHWYFARFFIKNLEQHTPSNGVT